MFAVHGPNGRAFRGTLEEMRVQGLERARPSRPIARQGDEAAPWVAAAGAAPEAGSSGYEAAARAYRDMLRAEPERGPLYHAWQVMNRDLLTLASWTPVDEAWQLLAQRGLRQATVLDAAEALIGLVGREDLLTALNLDDGRPRDVLERSVAQVMASPVVSADPVTDIRRIARVMLDYGQTAVPVVNESGQLLGLVSRGDILRAVTAQPPLSLWG